MGNLETPAINPEAAKKAAPEQSEKVQDIVESKDMVRERAKRAREANENDEKVVYTYDKHELGKWELSDEEKQKRPNIDNSSSYVALGGVDSTSFNPDKVDTEMLMKLSNWADKFAEAYISGKIHAKTFDTLTSPATEDQVLSIVDDIAQAGLKVKQGRFNMEDFRNKMSKYDDKLVYGPKGAFNILLAMHRADEAISDKKAENVIYDLRLGTKKLSQAFRYSEVWEKKKVDTSQEDRENARRAEESSREADKKIAEFQREENLETEKNRAVDELGKSLDVLSAEYQKKYGYEVKFEKTIDKKGQKKAGKKNDVVFTTVVKNKTGIERSFSARVILTTGAVKFSITDGKVSDAVMFDSVKDAVGALKGKMDFKLEGMKTFDKEEHLDMKKDFSDEVDAFFNGNYLNSSIRAVKGANGLYAGGVQVGEAMCVIPFGNEAYFVYPNASNRTIDLKLVQEVKPNEWSLKTVATVDVGYLKTAKGGSKLDDVAAGRFAGKLTKVLENLRKERLSK